MGPGHRHLHRAVWPVRLLRGAAPGPSQGRTAAEPVAGAAGDHRQDLAQPLYPHRGSRSAPHRRARRQGQLRRHRRIPGARLVDFAVPPEAGDPRGIPGQAADPYHPHRHPDLQFHRPGGAVLQAFADPEEGQQADPVLGLQHPPRRRPGRFRRPPARSAPHRRQDRAEHSLHRQPAVESRCVRAADAAGADRRQPPADRGQDQAFQRLLQLRDHAQAGSARPAAADVLRADQAAGATAQGQALHRSQHPVRHERRARLNAAQRHHGPEGPGTDRCGIPAAVQRRCPPRRCRIGGTAARRSAPGGRAHRPSAAQPVPRQAGHPQPGQARLAASSRAQACGTRPRQGCRTGQGRALRFRPTASGAE